MISRNPLIYVCSTQILGVELFWESTKPDLGTEIFGNTGSIPAHQQITPRIGQLVWALET
jgi:hypothetical protein